MLFNNSRVDNNVVVIVAAVFILCCFLCYLRHRYRNQQKVFKLAANHMAIFTIGVTALFCLFIFFSWQIKFYSSLIAVLFGLWITFFRLNKSLCVHNLKWTYNSPEGDDLVFNTIRKVFFSQTIVLLVIFWFTAWLFT